MRKGINVFSGFDGIRVFSQVAKNLNVPINYCYSSEIDKDAIDVGRKNHPACVEVGDICNVSACNLDFIDLVVGGSPCQDFSMQGSKDGMKTIDDVTVDSFDKYKELKSSGYEFKGQSYLFWEWYRVLLEVSSENPNVKFWLENVKMDNEWQAAITKALGVEPVLLNSADAGAPMSRPRYVWANFDISQFSEPEHDLALKDITLGYRDDHVMMSDMQYIRLVDAGDSNGACRPLLHKDGRRTSYQVFDTDYKVECLTTSQGGGRTPSIPWHGGARNLHPIEYERCFSLPDNYTAYGISGKKMKHGPRKKMLGNSWDVLMFEHVFNCLLKTGWLTTLTP